MSSASDIPADTSPATQPGAPMTYAGAGVDYTPLDAFKRAAQLAAKDTAGNVRVIHGVWPFTEYAPSRGESVYLVDTPAGYFALVEEGLGTKSLVADALAPLTGRSWYDHVAQCTVAMIVNDMITAGALPITVAMHLAVGSSDWFDDRARTNSLITGWKKACNLAQCTWGPGETPSLKGIVVLGTALLSGSAMGFVTSEKLIRPSTISDGDAIVIIESSGIHANGLTLAREIAARLVDGYMTKLSDGRTYGETLLDPTHIYVGFMKRCLDDGIPIHYAVNMTGHGWRKLMRAPQSFTYVIDRLPTQLPIFDFIQEWGPVSDREAYGNLNMGAGFAVYVPQDQVEVVVSYARASGLKAFRAGHIESGPKQVVITPKGITFEADTLDLR